MDSRLAVGTALLLPAVGTALSSWVLGSHPWLFFFVLDARPFRVLLLTSPATGCDRVAVSCSRHALHTSSFGLFPG